MRKRSSLGWSKPWPAGTASPRPLCGMASGAGGVNALVCAAWLAQVPLFGFKIHLPVDPLAVLIRIFPPEIGSGQACEPCEERKQEAGCFELPLSSHIIIPRLHRPGA